MTRKHLTLRDKIIKGLELTHVRLVQSKKERNLDLVFSDNGKIVRMHPKDL
jgi:hypothetical protein